MSTRQPLTPLGAALAGALGGCFSNAVVYPLDVAKTRIQAANTDARAQGRKGDDRLNMRAVLLRILREEGVGGWYKGFAATMLNTFSMQYAYFFFYSFVRTSYIRRLTSRLPTGSKPPALSTAAELILGAIAGALAQIFTIPVSVIATRQQVGRSVQASRRRIEASASSSSSAASEPSSLSSVPSSVPQSEEEEEGHGDEPKTYAQAASEPPAASSDVIPTPNTSSPQQEKEKVEEEDGDTDSFLAVAREIVREEGVTGLWLGIKPGLVLTVNPAITYGVYERVKSVMTLGSPDGRMGPWRAFVVGALSKTLATVVTYPYIMAKVRIQARSADADADAAHGKPHHLKGSAQPQHVGAVDILARVLKTQGIKGWYQGMSAQIVKAVLSQALLFMSKDQFEGYAFAIMMFLYKMRGQK